ncbi:TniQ family protein [Aerosakkonemataceae cyanobacterium BLCC-F50]|uniref:TniQ family protein n=1 Tax=Floridaenema flaviceps BLCC-F50 TaxID=3153642 RepID=A0ABV4XNN6_9CYAN
MLANELTTYESWNLKKENIPSRSRLYQLGPVGIGTPLVESLTGYIARLAEAHCVPSGILMERELAPLIKEVPADIDLTKNRTRTGVFGHTGTFNGIGVMAENWMKALSILTQRQDLRFLTMLTWAEVFPAKGLLRNNWAYCSICYEEWREAQQLIYEPLLWAINGVDICMKHHQPLLHQCFHCGKSLSPLAWRSRPGYCSKCGQWLGSKLDTESSVCDRLTEQELRYQLWAVKSIGELVAAQANLTWTPSSQKIGKAFSICIDRITEGNIAAFARLIGKPKNTVWTWQTGKALPQISVLTQICYNLKVLLLDFLSGDCVAATLDEATIVSQHQRPKTEISPKSNCDLDQLRQKLEAIKDGDEYPPPCMEEVAKRLGYNTRFLRRQFLDLCRAISERYIDYRKTVRTHTIEQLCKDVQQTALEIYAEGQEPTRSRVAKRLAKPAYFREKQVEAALSEIRYQLGLNS